VTNVCWLVLTVIYCFCQNTEFKLKTNYQKNNVHNTPNLVDLYILPSSQIGDSWRKEVEVFTIQPENMHIYILTLKVLA